MLPFVEMAKKTWRCTHAPQVLQVAFDTSVLYCYNTEERTHIWVAFNVMPSEDLRLACPSGQSNRGSLAAGRNYGSKDADLTEQMRRLI